MSKSIILNRMAILGGHRISRDANRISYEQSRTEEMIDVWEDKSDRYELGTWQGSLDIQGRTDEEVEKRFLAELAKDTAPSLPLTVFLANGNGAPGGDALQVDACGFSFKLDGERGKVQQFTLMGKPHDRMAIGGILRSSIGTAGVSGADVGTAVNLGAITATQKMVVVYHLLNYPAAEGTSPTLDSKIQSATDEPFTTPVDRATLTQLTATPIGLVAEIAGPVTDTWWRHNVTAVGGTDTPILWVVVSAAIIAA